MAEVGSAVVSKVVELLFGVAKNEISYMWNYTQNVERLKNVLQDLKDMTRRVQQQIDLAKTKGDKLVVGVEQWVERVNDDISKAERFLTQEANTNMTFFKLCMCGNWVTLYRYSKMATKKASSLLRDQEGGKTFENRVSVETRAPGPIDLYQNKNLDDINTHKLALQKIIEAIEDENVQIIGIYGLGGAGKTTLAMEVASKMKKQFVSVVIITVSQNVNAKKIKDDILNETKQIMQGKKILIILDDVWEKLDLEQLGIPYGINHMNCKILLTSRNVDICKKMNAQRTIPVEPLQPKESWILFKRVVGEEVEADDNLKQVAMKVAEECGGLPLLVQAVGYALKDKNIESWNSALTRLQKHEPSDIDPDIKKAFIHLKLSYDYLESEEVKSCFLLCSLFPEDETILLEDLVYYGVGLEKFNEIEIMYDARDRVRNAVDILTSSSLLLDTKEKESTKMHDVVRDVALLIASKSNNKFFVQAGKHLREWLPRKSTYEGYTRISLMKNYINKLPDYDLHFPYLDTFLIRLNQLSTISNEFIGSMKEVKVLDLEMNKISSLPESFSILTKLRMLNLRGNKYLQEISILGGLKDLEILILRETGIKEIPRELGQLDNLRVFDVRRCEDLRYVTPGVISGLWRLEELRIELSSSCKGIYDILVEVMNLSKLTYLDLFVPCFDVIPEGFACGKMKTFKIQIGIFENIIRHSPISESHTIIYLDSVEFPLLKRIKNVIEVNSTIILYNIKNLKNILPTMYDIGFNDSRSIMLVGCTQISYLVDVIDWNSLQSKDHLGDEDEGKMEEKFFMKLKHLYLRILSNLKALSNCPDQFISLRNLVTLHIENCKQLVRVFSVSVAQSLVRLQELSIIYCGSLEEVIWDGDNETKDRADETKIVEHDASIIVFPSLAKISLHFLMIKRFCSGNYSLKYPSLVKVTIINCSSMKKWGNGIQETPKLKFVDNLPILDGPYVLNDVMAKSSDQWKISITG